MEGPLVRDPRGGATGTRYPKGREWWTLLGGARQAYPDGPPPEALEAALKGPGPAFAASGVAWLAQVLAHAPGETEP